MLASPLLLDWSLTKFSEFGSFVSGIAGAIATVFAYKAIMAQKNANLQVGNLLALNEFMIDNYVNRKAITYREEMKASDFVLDREQVRKLFMQNPEQWQQDCLTTVPSRNQAIMNEMSHSLQHLGLAAFVGTIPLRLLLVNLGDSIILDWLVIKPAVDSYRQQGMVYSTRVASQIVFAKRRHAEWLALIAFVWLIKNWHYETQFGQALIRMTSKGYYDSLEQIEQKIQNITLSDHGVLSVETKREVKRLIGLHL